MQTEAAEFRTAKLCATTIAMNVGDIIFGSFFLLILCGWVGLGLRWRKEMEQARALIALVGASLPVLLDNAARIYARYVAPIPASDYRVEKAGFFISVAAIVVAGRSVKCSERWIPGLTLITSVAMLILYLLAGMTV